MNYAAHMAAMTHRMVADGKQAYYSNRELYLSNSERKLGLVAIIENSKLLNTQSLEQHWLPLLASLGDCRKGAELMLCSL